MRVMVAERWHQRTRGLLGRRMLDKSEGMLIIPCRSVHTIGMTYAIDVVFLDSLNTVVSARIALDPCRCAMDSRACAVLELAPGTIARLGIGVGDTVAMEMSGVAGAVRGVTT
ncbi:DUF192 domain-containing protein [Burkholderia metallica]|nr:DUF192 domain-containing protein [Burkholderia metallica]